MSETSTSNLLSPSLSLRLSVSLLNKVISSMPVTMLHGYSLSSALCLGVAQSKQGVVLQKCALLCIFASEHFSSELH